MACDPILLIYDGHESHEAYKLLRLAKEQYYSLLAPPTYHQPLVSLVHLQMHGFERCDDCIEVYLEEIPRDQFLKQYRSFKGTTIRAAFRRSGIWLISLLMQTFPPVTTPQAPSGTFPTVIQFTPTMSDQSIRLGQMIISTRFDDDEDETCEVVQIRRRAGAVLVCHFDLCFSHLSQGQMNAGRGRGATAAGLKQFFLCWLTEQSKEGRETNKVDDVKDIKQILAKTTLAGCDATPIGDGLSTKYL